jgi:hypothetical protein
MSPTSYLPPTTYHLLIKCHDIVYSGKCHDIVYRHNEGDGGESYARSP